MIDMRLPWFMHTHARVNTLTGVFPTPSGTFVRSCADGRMEVAWYPMDASFPGGSSREVKRLATVEATDAGERDLEDAVVDFMHSHPDLSLSVRHDDVPGAALDWSRTAGGTLATLETPHGVFFCIRHGGVATLEFLPAGGHGNRETVAVLSDACGEDTLSARIDGRVRRRIARVETRDAQRMAA
jgi:hypothetical protein